MLKFLHIENIAVIESTDIEFGNGFNVLTGETGAGKSIIIDAINAILGERTSKDLIRAGCDWAEVSAVFGNLSKENLLLLKEKDIFPDEDGNILIIRKLSLSGKGLIKIGGKPSTATILKEIAPILVNIHGQHDNQALLKSEKHIDFIDAIAENNAQREEYYTEFKNLNAIRKELIELQNDIDDKQIKTELLKHQINEIETACVKVGEIEDLKNRLTLAESFEQTVKSLNTVANILSGDEDTDGVITNLKTALRQLSLLKDETTQNNCGKLNEVLSVLQDINADVSLASANMDFSNYNPDEINQRLDLLYRLMLKYGNSEEKILEFLNDAKHQLDNITYADKREEELSLALESSKERLVNLGLKLTDSREKASRKFEDGVSENLSYLNMPDVKFSVSMEKGRYTKLGCDVLEFMLSANKGETLKPLSKTASGGELSRTMLAIKSSLLDKDPVGTMIFDEIDTGISGFAAERVGNKLKSVSFNRQVICVTHLAQIAAKADNHLLIEKSTVNDRTYTKVISLDYDARINEIARIMSGSQVTENLYNSAKELIDRSLQNENL